MGNNHVRALPGGQRAVPPTRLTPLQRHVPHTGGGSEEGLPKEDAGEIHWEWMGAPSVLSSRPFWQDITMP
ncbi:Hypothetical protein FKW44_014765 [Caligus rogercresseyi]|uniref:Uncharacterized protein n=1 Tax=Caligus rogercresseyi TaxID=217165 RepID=A0A7T8JZ68_CALRO|nr:Hypothetical protein FKW44_014765 [Caligus rogercresseyi]